MSKLTIVETGPARNSWIYNNLEEAGLDVSEASPSEDLVVSISELRSQLVLFAPSIPKITAFEACRALRSHRDTATIGLIIMAEDFTVQDRIEGISAGADDCLPTTTSIDELVARLASIMRRLLQTCEGDILQSGEVRLDRKSRRVTRNGKTVALGPVEYRLLEELMRNKGHAVERQALAAKGWPTATIDDGMLTVYVTRLRRPILSTWSEVYPRGAWRRLPVRRRRLNLR